MLPACAPDPTVQRPCAQAPVVLEAAAVLTKQRSGMHTCSESGADQSGKAFRHGRGYSATRQQCVPAWRRLKCTQNESTIISTTTAVLKLPTAHIHVRLTHAWPQCQRGQTVHLLWTICWGAYWHLQLRQVKNCTPITLKCNQEYGSCYLSLTCRSPRSGSQLSAPRGASALAVSQLMIGAVQPPMVPAAMSFMHGQTQVRTQRHQYLPPRHLRLQI